MTFKVWLAHLKCKYLGHVRSMGRAYQEQGSTEWKSYCRNCGIRMAKKPEGTWETVE